MSRPAGAGDSDRVAPQRWLLELREAPARVELGGDSGVAHTVVYSHPVELARLIRNPRAPSSGLGPTLFQVVFHATLGEEGRFTLADVALGIHDKSSIRATAIPTSSPACGPTCRQR